MDDGQIESRGGAARGGRPFDLRAELAAAGVLFEADALTSLLRGVAAAPAPFRSDAWLPLISEKPLPPGLVAALQARVAAERLRLVSSTAPCGERLGLLRRVLKRLRLAGFVVPHADKHHGESVPLRGERLRWLTGFTGSAGSAVVLTTEAALFVDGRYTVQARDQVDRDSFEIRHSLAEPMIDWIAERLPARGRLGYDPWLATPAQVAQLEEACSRADGRAVAVAANPVDELWIDQPPPPLSPIVPHDLAYAGVPAREKRERVAETLRSHGRNAAVLIQPESIAWLLNVRGGDVAYTPVAFAFMIVHDDATVEVFTDRRKVTAAARAAAGAAVSWREPAAFEGALVRLGERRARVAIDPESSPAWVTTRLRSAHARVVYAADPCAAPRAVKNDVELAGERAAHRRDAVAVIRFLRWLDDAMAAGGVTEVEAAERLDAFRAEGARFRGLSFPTISGADANGAVVHYRATPATDRRLSPGSVYLVDSGGQYLDGTTDVTRTVFLGASTAAPPEEVRTRFTQVLRGHIAIATALFPRGTTGAQLDVLAREALWRAGVDYDHGTGHGVGSFLGVHEGPQRISKQPSRVALEPGMVLSNEPGYYRPGSFGIRIENLVVVATAPTPTGGELPMLTFDTLTLVPIDRALIDPRLLTKAEIAWIDRYHAAVLKNVGPLLDADDAGWLTRRTRPLCE